MMKKYWFCLFIILMGSMAFAADSCALTGGGTYDDVLNAFVTTAMTWNATLLPAVLMLFWGFFAMEFLYQVIFKKVIANDIQKLYVFFVVRIFTAYMFAQIFLHIEFYTGIVTYFTNLGAKAGGVAMSVTQGATGMGVTPSGIMAYLECEFSAVLVVITTAAFVPMIGEFFSIALIILILLMNLFAVIVAVAMVDAYIVLFGGFILCGFSGSSWTQSWWQKYLSYAIATGIRLFVTCLILGMITTVFTNVSFTDNPVNYLFSLLGVLLLAVYMMMTIPSKAASMLTGGVGGGLGEMVGAASMVMSGAMGGAGIMAAGKSLAGGATGAAGAGRTAAMGKARELLSGGAGGSGSSGSNPADWKSQSKQAGSAAASQHMKDSWAGAKSALTGGSSSGTGGSNNKGAVGKMGAAASQAGKLSGGHAGAADVNINPHRE